MLIDISIGLFLGFWMILFILPLIPGVVQLMANEPNRYRPPGAKDITYEKSTYGFFTFLQPGRVKIIERGERFIKCIMAFDGHMFFGERPDNHYEPEHYQYWQVVESIDPVTGTVYSDSHPIPFPVTKLSDLDRNPWWILYSPLSTLWWLWKRWVFFVTGAVFAGIPPFQNVRTYPIEHHKKITNANGEVTLDRIRDLSDHYRVADFQYPIKVPSADTRDKIQVSMILNEVARVSNPYMVAYNTDDDWTTRFQASISNAVTTVTRSRTLDEVLSAADETQAQVLRDRITHFTQGPVAVFGLHVERTEVIDISPVNPDIAKRLGDVAIARVDREADQERAIGRAAYIREEGAAMAAHPNSEIIVQSEAMVRAAEAAGRNGGIVILGGGSIDPMQAAILKQLKQGNTGGTP